METLTFRPEERAVVLYNKAISQDQGPLAFNYFSADYYNPRKPVFDFRYLSVCFAIGLT